MQASYVEHINMNCVVSRAVNTTRRLINLPACMNIRHFGSMNRILTDVNEKTGICTMQLNGPPANILDGDMLDAATKSIQTAESMKEVRGVLLTSNFKGKIFSAGLNLMDLYEKPHSHIFEYWTLVQEWYLSWFGCSKPTVAAINGHALAGGCAWALMCDYRIMQADDRRIIGFTETKVGISAPFFMADLVTSVLNPRPTELTLLRGSVFEAKEALKIGDLEVYLTLDGKSHYGFVDEVSSLDSIVAKGEEQLQSFMSISPKAYQLTKFLFRQKNIAKVSAIRKDDAKQVADQVTQPAVQERIGMYLASLKSKRNES